LVLWFSCWESLLASVPVNTLHFIPSEGVS
jgi:hypothetical protein